MGASRPSPDDVRGPVGGVVLLSPDGGTVLDFGSSSGRVLRILAAARPDLRCLGCDPNEDAIAWAEVEMKKTLAG